MERVEAPLVCGTRVRVRSAAQQVTLRAETGWIVRPDRWQGYYVVRLDQPAIYHMANGAAIELPQLVETASHLQILR